MPQTLVQLFAHVIFSTKNRLPTIRPEIEPELFAYIGGIANNNNSKLLAAGGTEDHVHLLISLSKNMGLSELVGDIKRSTSAWIKKQDDQYSGFGWQDGYGAFSVGNTQLDSVKAYIANQKQHHGATEFEDEFRYFLHKYDVDYDERYV